MGRFTRNLISIPSRFSRATLISSIPVAGAIVLSGFVSYGYNFLLKESGGAVDHTFLVLSKIDSTLLRLQDAETGQRGFIITGDSDYLAPFIAAEEQIFKEISDLEKLVSDNAEQKSRTLGLQQLANAKFNELKETIEVRRRDGIEAARLSVIRSSGKEVMDRMRSITGEMRDKERALLETRLTALHWAEGLILLVAAIGFVLSLGGRFVASLVRGRISRP
jgi:methyl-accepting chemotaxis protein